MADKPRTAVIGGFILASLILVLIAIAVWGSGRFFQEKYRAICYFSGSVSGLDPGAAVKFRGVQVGTVVDIRLHYDQAPTDTRIPVFVDLDEKRIREQGVGKKEPFPVVFKELIDRGLRARLESQSLVTGQLYVNLDLVPGSPIEAAHVGPSEYPEIPTLPTTLEEATKSISAFLEQIRKADLAGTVRSLENALEAIDRLASRPAIGRTLGELPPTIGAFRGLIEELQTSLAGRGPIVVELQRALIDVQKAASSVGALAEYLQRNPNALIVGRKRAGP